MRGWKAHPEVQEGLENPHGGPGENGKLTRRYERGQYAHPEVWKVLGGPCKGPEGPP